jgi:hypothetical protein
MAEYSYGYGYNSDGTPDAGQRFFYKDGRLVAIATATGTDGAFVCQCIRTGLYYKRASLVLRKTGDAMPVHTLVALVEMKNGGTW